MSDRTLYIQRTDRGDRLLGLHLVGPRTHDAWQAGDTSSVDGALSAVREGAAWVKERLSSSERHTLTAICLDPDGTICSWLTAPGSDPTVLGAIARGMGQHAHDGDHEGESTGAPAARALDHFATVGSGMSLQALGVGVGDDGAREGGKGGGRRGGGRGGAKAGEGERRRLAVLGVPDSVAGLLIDELDSLGVSAPPAVSLWHAMARSWDPASPGQARADGPRSDRLVAEQSTVTAVVLVEASGRLVWAWSREGELVTGGSMRLMRSRTGAGAGAGAVEGMVPRLDPSHASRLAAEWLSWSAQTGQAPGRVVLVTPERTAGMEPAALAGALVKAWPGALVDVLTSDEPVVQTLQRAIEDDAPAGAGGVLEGLSARPSRAHRSMFVWTALSITGLAAAAAVGAFMSWRTAGDARGRATALKSQTSMLVLEHYNGDPTAAAAGVVLTLQDELMRAQAAEAPADAGQFMPVLEELENISLAVSSLIASNPACEMRSLTVDNVTGVQLTVRFPGTTPADVATFENFRVMLREIGVSRLGWTDGGLASQGAAVGEVTFRGSWVASRPGGGA